MGSPDRQEKFKAYFIFSLLHGIVGVVSQSNLIIDIFQMVQGMH